MTIIRTSNIKLCATHPRITDFRARRLFRLRWIHTGPHMQQNRLQLQSTLITETIAPAETLPTYPTPVYLWISRSEILCT